MKTTISGRCLGWREESLEECVAVLNSQQITAVFKEGSDIRED